MIETSWAVARGAMYGRFERVDDIVLGVKMCCMGGIFVLQILGHMWYFQMSSGET
jgi:hypothetical protein